MNNEFDDSKNALPTVAHTILPYWWEFVLTDGRVFEARWITEFEFGIMVLGRENEICVINPREIISMLRLGKITK